MHDARHRDRIWAGGVACALSFVAATGCSSRTEQVSTECDACAIDAGPPAAQGTASLHLVSAAGASCAQGPRWMNVPIADIAQPTVTGSMIGERAVDGENGAVVSCTVILIGGGYAMSGDFDVAYGDRFSRVSANALIDPKTSDPQPISVHVEDEAVVPLHQGDCSLVPGLDGLGWGSALRPGRFWGKLVCSSLLLADADAGGASGCAIDEGYIELENCP
jgi:hypothetical protein